MAEDADELVQLAAVDPADRHHDPVVASAAVADLFERITMTEIDPHAQTNATRSRRAPLVAIAAAVVLVVALAAGAVIARDDGDVDDVAAEVSGEEPGAAPITPGAVSSGSCVERYDLSTLADREVAFAGTVAALEGDSATFDVDRWFRGGTGAQVTLDGAGALSGMTSAGEAVLELGAPVLVAGDGGFAWACGFTQPYDDAVADQWADVFAD